MVRVLDGDTIVVAGVGTVRYIGIDTPELHHPTRPVERMARRAWQINRRLVGGRSVTVVFQAEQRDTHGRLLADVYVNGRFVNGELVRRGLARTLAIRPNIRHADLLRRLERRAQESRSGLWGAAEGGVPWGRP